MYKTSFIHIKEVINMLYDKYDIKITAIWQNVKINEDYSLEDKITHTKKTGKFSGLEVNSLNRGSRSQPLFISVRDDELISKLEDFQKAYEGRKVELNLELEVAFGKKTFLLKGVSLVR
jgi:FKBP-type peptidyl-prolyl cis-trans isomerase 2